jgi:hypothetical protein
MSISTTGSLEKDRHYIRVYSARGDASGQREMKWAVGGYPVGDAKCTRTFHISDPPGPQERPTMLLCWRITAAKSVYVFSVDVRHPPSDQEALAALHQTWAKMG